MAAKKKSEFNAWLDTYGQRRLALYLKVHPKTVLLWRSGHCDPRVDQMRRIKKLTDGLVTYDMMIDRRPITTKGTYRPKAR